MIFKKRISLVLAFFLLVSNLGLAFNVHYCGNEIDTVSLSSSSQNVDCCCRIVEKESSCCNDKIIKAEIKSDQIIYKSLTFDIDFQATNTHCKPIVSASNFNFKQRDNSTYYCDANAPPLYLLYSQYTFYC
jgi:hypothetical protein